MKNTAIPAPPDPGLDARRRDLARTTMIDGITEIDPDAWDVPSGSKSGVTYRVRRNRRGVFTCDCVGFGYRCTCGHTRLVRAMLDFAQLSFAALERELSRVGGCRNNGADVALRFAAIHQRERDLMRRHDWPIERVWATYSQF